MTSPGGQNRRCAGRGGIALVGLLVPPIVTACVTAGCSGGADGGVAVAVDTVASGAVLVRNGGNGLWEGGEAWRVEERLRIGSAEAGSPDAFGTIWALALDSLDRLYIADGTGIRIRAFDLEGGHVRSFGREGEGPGELDWVAGLGIAGDRGWAIDYGTARYSVFDAAGSLLETRQRRAGRYFVPWPGAVAAGAVHDFLLGAGDSVRIVRGSPGGPADTVAIASFRPRPVPFEPEPILAIDGRGAWLADAAEYRLRRFDRGGRIVRIIERGLAPRRISAREKREALESYRTRRGRVAAASGEAPRRAVTVDELPDVEPLLREIFTDDRGFLWAIRRSEPADSVGSIDVFDPHGRFLGEVLTGFPLAPRPRPLVRGELFVAVTRDALGVERIVIARIAGRARDLR